MKHLIAYLGIAILQAASACSAAEEHQAPGNTEQLLEAFRAEYDVPGLAIVIADDHDVLDFAAVGVKRVDNVGKIEPSSRFHLGSVSKPITSAAIGALVDSGAIGWDTKVLDVIPKLQQTARPEYAEITLRQLLSHTAGIQPFEEDEEFLHAPAFEGSVREQRLAFTEWLLTLQPVAPPGTAHVYSNAGYTIAASVVEHLLEEDFDIVVRQHLFIPLGIASAGVGPPSAKALDAPWGHTRSNDEWLVTDPSQGSQIRDLILPAGDFHMNLIDLAKFGSAQLRGINGADDVLKSSTVLTIHDEVMDGYALGWNVRDRFNSHLGGLEGMHTAVLLIMKSDNRVYAIAVNAELEDSGLFGRLISELRKTRN